MKTWLKILIAVVLTIIIVGGGTYYYMQRKLTNDKNNLQSQIDSLNKQIKDLQTTSSTSSTSTTATTDPTAGWKTYTNSTYGFSFKYPADLAAISTNSYAEEGKLSDNLFKIYFQGGHDPNNNTPLLLATYSLFAVVYDGNSISNISDWLVSKFRNTGELSSFSPTLVANKIAGEAAYSAQVGCCAGYDYSYFFRHGGKIFRIGTNYESAGTNHGAYLDSIVATFQFTK
ncbi:MAG: PsbP-related protein [Candidatus Berkelbacteria bacterium]|nr:PsbP-related protein [Candidatus Berkelbacteria bacterium]